jgi:hypothetical protein
MITFSNIGRNGRMGNQMFQYAFLVGIATKNNYEFGVSYSNKSSDEYKHFCLPDCFDKLTAKDSSSYMCQHYILDPDWVFNSNFFNIPDSTDFCGYFQSEKYFKHCKDKVKEEFTFNESIQSESTKLISNLVDPISLHIRLGDYVMLQNHHPVCDNQYYEKALNLLPKESSICVFTDDVVLAQQIFKDQFANRDVLYLNTGNKFVDMCIMSKCSYHVIANSSFSWWGAWLAESKKTIAPEKWFGSASHIQGKHHDIYCDGWEII